MLWYKKENLGDQNVFGIQHSNRSQEFQKEFIFISHGKNIEKEKPLPISPYSDSESSIWTSDTTDFLWMVDGIEHNV